MHFVLRSKLCQGFLFFQEFLDYFGLEGRCVLLSHHALVYLIPDPFPVQFLGSIIVEGEPKTKAGRRKILLPRVVVNALKEHKARQDEARAKMGDRWKEHGLIFCNKYGGFFNPDYVWYLFKKMLKEAGLPDVRFHDFHLLLHLLKEQQAWLSMEADGLHGALVVVTTARQIQAASSPQRLPPGVCSTLPGPLHCARWR